MARLIPPLFALIGTTILVLLGSWQMQRLAWKEGLIAEREAALAAAPTALPAEVRDGRALDFRKVEAAGEFRHDLEQLFGVSARNGVLGYDVLTPLVRADGPAVLVDRGWVPAEKAHPAARRAGEVAGAVTVRGIARYRADDRPGLFAPANQPAARQWFAYDLPAMEQALGLDLAPLVIEADATPNPGGLPLGGQTRILLPNNHLQYAITWYGLAAGLVAVYIVFQRQQRRKPAA